MDVEALKKMDHKTKIRIGLIMGIFCALYWGVWYVPGYAVWNMDILTQLTPNIEADGFGYDFSYLTTCLFLTGFNAIACAIVLFIWNGALGCGFRSEDLHRVGYAGGCGGASDW